MGLLSYIWTNKINRVILVGLGLVIIIAFIIKFAFWSKLTLAPFVFFGLAIPAQLIWTNSITYKFFSEWTTFVKDYSHKLELKRGLKVYIKNFWPWAEMAKLKNTIRALDMPYYDFDKADILESSDLIIIYGQSDHALGFLTSRTRPFGINLTGTKLINHRLYQVTLTSMNETNDFKELTFIDSVIGTDNPITIRIYNNRNETPTNKYA